MSVSLVLFIAKVCLGLLIAQVWKHKLARSESCYCASGVTPRPELRPSTLPKCFRLPTFFVYTVDKEAVTSCKFAMQAEEVCFYTSVKFDLCSHIFLLPSRLEGSFLILSQTTNPVPLISFSLAGIVDALTSQSFLLSRISLSQVAASTSGHALQVGELRKRTLLDASCAAIGVTFVPVLFEALRGLSSLTTTTISTIGHHLGQRIGSSPADTNFKHVLLHCGGEMQLYGLTESPPSLPEWMALFNLFILSIYS